MTRNQSYKKDLIKYRLECARDTLRDAHVLKENGGSPASIVNRAYYSVFYAALALLVTVNVEPTKQRQGRIENGIICTVDNTGRATTVL
jgi:uncharacterized protein (UPF0332 family)